MKPAAEIREIWNEIKSVKRFYEKNETPIRVNISELIDKYEEIDTLFGHESTLSKAIIYYLNKNL